MDYEVETIEKPSNLDEFQIWFKNKFDFNKNKYDYYYSIATEKMRSNIESTTFWKKLLNELKEANDRYLMDKKVNLLHPSDCPKIYIKPLDSLIIKAYRKNILNNKNFPDPPNNGWITHNNWFQTINDIARTTITVKYLDGVQFLINEVEMLAKMYQHEFKYSFEAREEGYYAAHTNTSFDMEIPDNNFQPYMGKVNLEIQITTQIQEIIKTLLHKHYEENRKKTIPQDYKWQWDQKSPEFTSNYLGHIIHYVEGMIVEIRDKEK